MAAKSKPVGSGSGAPYDESLEDWIMVPNGDAYLVGKLTVSERSIFEEMSLGEVPRATIRHIYHFSAAYMHSPKSGIFLLRSSTKIERLLELDPFEIVEMDVILVGVIFLSRRTLESRRAIVRKLEDADRRNGLAAQLKAADT